MRFKRTGGIDSLGALAVVLVDGGHVREDLSPVDPRPVEGTVREDVDVVPSNLNISESPVRVSNAVRMDLLSG